MDSISSNPPGTESLFTETEQLIDAAIVHNALYERRVQERSSAFDTSGKITIDALTELINGSGQAIDITRLPIYDLDNDRYPDWIAAQDFYFHDIAKLRLGWITYYGESAEINSKKDGCFRLPEDIQDLYRQVVSELSAQAELISYPHKFLKALLVDRRGGEIAEETFSLQKLLHTLARHIQMRGYLLDFVLSEPNSRQEERNELIVDSQAISLHANRAIITSIALNVIKNAYKEIANACMENSTSSDPIPINPLRNRMRSGELPENPQKIYIQANEVPDAGMVVINILDSGGGYSFDQILKSLQILAKKRLVQQSSMEGILQVIAEWQSDPYALHDESLTVGSLIDATSIARVSGFGTDAKNGSYGDSSGLGLWGANFLIEKMGGRIMSTNTYDAGALITIIIPIDGIKHADDIRDAVSLRSRDLSKYLMAQGVRYPTLSVSV